jgi:hypothetical protein
MLLLLLLLLSSQAFSVQLVLTWSVGVEASDVVSQQCCTPGKQDECHGS